MLAQSLYNVDSCVRLPMVLATLEALCASSRFLPQSDIMINVCERANKPNSINQSILLAKHMVADSYSC